MKNVPSPLTNRLTIFLHANDRIIITPKHRKNWETFHTAARILE